MVWLRGAGVHAVAQPRRQTVSDLARIFLLTRLRPPRPPPPLLQVWKAAGMDMDNVEFMWASEEINTHANDYWLRVMDIARKFNVPRVSSTWHLMPRRTCSAPIRVLVRSLVCS